MDRPIKLEELDAFINNFEENLDDLLLYKSKMEASGDDKLPLNKKIVDEVDVYIRELRERIIEFNGLAELAISGCPIYIEDDIIVPDYSIV